MSEADQILPGTGRGTATRSGVVEGALHESSVLGHAPSTSFAGPPPRAGEDLRGDFPGLTPGWHYLDSAVTALSR